MSEGEKMMLADAIKTAIESERTIINLKREIYVLTVICCALAVSLLHLIR